MRIAPWPLVLAVALAACKRTPPPPAGTRVDPILVPQRSFGIEPVMFHPDLPRGGQLRDGGCDIWDLEERVYRGRVTAATCVKWTEAPARPVSAAVREGTPHARAGRGDELVIAASPDGRWSASARRGGDRVHVWDAGAASSPRALVKPAVAQPIAQLMVSSDKVVAITDGGPAIVWDLAGGAGRFPIDFDIESAYLDPAGRYFAAIGTAGGRIPPKEIAVVRMADEKIVLSSVETPRFDTRRAVWARDRAVALAVRLDTIPLEPCRDEQIRAELRSLERPSIHVASIERGKLALASISPDGSGLVLAFTEMSECSEETLATRQKRAYTWVHRRGEGGSAQQKLEGLAVEAAWSASGARAALAMEGGEIVLLDASLGAGAPLARWPGRAPVAVSPDGARVASVENGMLTARVAGRATALIDGARAAAWSDTTLAVAVAGAIVLFDAASLAVRHRISVAEVRSLAFDPERGALCALTKDGALVVDAKGRAQALSAGGDATATWAAGRLVLREPTKVRRFHRVGDEWRALDEREVRAEGAVSADGAFEIFEDGYRRLADGEVLRFGEDGAYTEGGAYERVVPKEWMFREGDTLAGRMIRPNDAAFLRPTPDLVARFSSGNPIPHFEGHDDQRHERR